MTALPCHGVGRLVGAKPAVLHSRHYMPAGHKVYRIAETCLISLSASQQRLDNTASDSTAEKK
jgi:hypothetical protein